MATSTIPAVDKLPFEVGDIVKVITRDVKENKIHSAPFEGTVIAKRGSDENQMFTVRKVSVSKVAVEKIFPLNSPIIADIKIIKKGKVRRAKLYYLRKK